MCDGGCDFGMWCGREESSEWRILGEIFFHEAKKRGDVEQARMIMIFFSRFFELLKKCSKKICSRLIEFRFFPLNFDDPVRRRFFQFLKFRDPLSHFFQYFCSIFHFLNSLDTAFPQYIFLPVFSNFLTPWCGVFLRIFFFQFFEFFECLMYFFQFVSIIFPSVFNMLLKFFKF